MQPLASRLLAPAPSAPVRTGDSPTGALSPTHSHLAATGIRRASTACQSCKQIKRKCDQAQPCSNCRKSNTRCVYNEAEDGRRKAARKRTVETLELKRDALDSILESFRTSTDGHAQHLLDLIRQNAPLEDIVQYATIHKGDLAERELQDIVSQINEQPRKNVMSVTALCDRPLVQVPSQPWTTITLDDEFVSHLVSIFFTWYATAYPTMDRNLFLRDMAAGSLNCQFCSPLLVNAILALACNFSDHPKSCQIPADGTTRGQHFFAEAARLWIMQEGKPSLVNVQAASLLAVASCLVGKDRLSWSYVEQMNEMHDELQLKHARLRKLGHSSATPELLRAEALTSETIFLLTVGYGIAFMKPSTNFRQLRKDSFASGLEQTSTWIPYPQQLPEISYDPYMLHTAFFELHKLGHQVQTCSFGSATHAESEEITILNEKLMKWKASLPEKLQLDPDSSAVRPPVFDLHLTYHFLRVSLFSFPDGHQIRASSSPTPTLQSTSTISSPRPNNNINASTTDLTTLVNARHSSEPPSANHQKKSQSFFQAQVVDSAREIALLCRLYARDLGLKQPSMWMPQAAASAAYSLIDGPFALADAEISDIFHELCSVLIAASRRWLVMKGHVRMLFMTVDTKGQEMHPRTKQLLQFVALEQWRDDDHKIFASSVYPNYTLAKDGDDPRMSGMGDLLEMWAGVTLAQDTATEGEVLETTPVESRFTSVTPSQSEGHMGDRDLDAQ